MGSVAGRRLSWGKRGWEDAARGGKARMECKWAGLMGVLADTHEQKTRFSSRRKAGWDGAGPLYMADEAPQVAVRVCAAASLAMWL